MIISSLSHENLIPKKRSLFHGDKPNLFFGAQKHPNIEAQLRKLRLRNQVRSRLD
jgi:hypothetical protein